MVSTHQSSKPQVLRLETHGSFEEEGDGAEELDEDLGL